MLPKNHLLSAIANYDFAFILNYLDGKFLPLLMLSPAFERVTLKSYDFTYTLLETIRVTFSEYSSTYEERRPKNSYNVGYRYVVFAEHKRVENVGELMSDSLNICQVPSTQIQVTFSSTFSG
jgi:hypothetical protein